MKTLHLSLIDYEIALLRGIATYLGISLDTPNHAAAVKLLVEALLSPAGVAIALGDLSIEEKAALQLLLNHNGQIEAPRFAREYGFIRPMGSARLVREKPWRNPVNPAEGLWYRGLIYKMFQATAAGNIEMVYIPPDLLPLLELTAPVPDNPLPAAEIFKVSAVPTPTLIINGQGRLRENMFNLLVYLQTTPVRLEHNSKPAEGVSLKDRQMLAACLLPSPWPAFSLEAELEFLLHLARRAGLLTLKHSRLRPDRDPARAWLQASASEQTQLLQNTWQADPTWNDLWHVPSLVAQPTGWENSPLLARSKLIGYLARLETAPDRWFSLDDFIAAIKRIEPDFQRPGGDYQSWYIYDRQNRLLMGFEYWDKVEGALIYYMLAQVLLWLGVVEMGAAFQTGNLTSFRITPSGWDFLHNRLSPSSAKKPPLLRVDTNFFTHVPAQASLYDRFQLARFAELDRREGERSVYRITQAGINRALKNGVAAEQITAFLARATDNQTPLKVVETILTWGTRQNTARLEQVTLLQLTQETMLAELRRHPYLGPLLGEALNPTTILIPADKVAEVRRLLVELGYLE